MQAAHRIRGRISTVSHVQKSISGPKRLAGLGGILALAVLAGCRSDNGRREVSVEFLRPTEWFDASSSATPEAPPKTGTSGKTRGDISVPPVPPAPTASSSPPPPVGSGKAYYSVRRTGSKNLLGGHSPWSSQSDERSSENGAQPPKLLRVPGSYD